MADSAIGTRAAVPPSLVRLAETCDAGVVLLKSRIPVLANTAARRLLALPAHDDVSAHWARVEALLPRSLAEHAAGAGSPLTGTIVIDGRTLILDIHPIDEGGTSDLLLILREAPQPAALDEALRHAARDRSLTWLARDLAHDLKGVLNLIVVNLALLSSTALSDDPDSDASEAGQRYASIIRRQVGRLDQAISLLLDQTVLSGTEPERFDLSECCHQVLHLLGPRASRSGVTINVDLPSASVVVDGYQDRVMVALLSLVVHALQAVSGGGSLTITVTLPEPQRARVLVADTGRGVPTETEGIDLLAARQVIEAHAGRLEHERTAEGGSRFTIDLPTAAPLPHS